MTKDIKRAYALMKKDRAFIEHALSVAPNDKEPNIFSDELTKHLWVSVYWGYLVALGRQEEVK